MKIVYSWLKDFVDIDLPAREVAEALTSAGLEVASVTELSIPEGVKVARVTSVEPHPNADRLSLCRVDDGSGEEFQVVCGAPNVTAGMLSAFATLGTKLAEDFTIRKAKIRGIESSGMLCAEDELGISDEHSGILSLPPEYKIGEQLSKYYPDDAVIEIEITPDRGDCLSVIGVAREVCARYNLPLKAAARRPQEKSDDPVENAISVEIESPERNPRYMGRLVRGVKIGPSPSWMQRRLTLAGLRPINNVVDITNYILLQYGQPMHAFDYNTLEDRKIIVRTAGSQETTTFTTLDDIERKLLPEDLLICDGKRPVALAGIMGGAGSEITQTTEDVFLECAFFEQIGVRKTSKRLGLSTDSSYRFERGVDPAQGLEDALDTAAELMRELAGGTVSAGRIDKYPEPFSEKKISLRPFRASRLLGVEFTVDQITTYLSSLGMQCTTVSEDEIQCIVPLFRHDVTEEVDLVEEVGRLYGYDNIPTAHTAEVSLDKSPAVVELNRDNARNALCYFGLNEIVTNSLVSEARRALLTPSTEPVKLLNPLSPDMAEMRTTLAANMLETVAYNLNRKNQNNRLFEIGKVFEPDKESGLAVEREVLAIIIEGKYLQQAWNSTPLAVDFFVLKGILEAFAAHCKMGELTFSRLETSTPLFGTEAASVCGNLGISGTLGRVSEKACQFFDIKSDVFYAELDLTSWLTAQKVLPEYKPLPKFPALERDFSFVMPEELSSDTVKKEIQDLSDLVQCVEPFDVYRGEKLGSGRKSVTFSVEFRSSEKTLSDSDVEQICDRILAVMEKKHQAVLRS
ncbi:MAG: phenylalanine--tRNA ligase subunit beta [Chitinispirillaceae bacterium]